MQDPSHQGHREGVDPENRAYSQDRCEERVIIIHEPDQEAPDPSDLMS